MVIDATKPVGSSDLVSVVDDRIREDRAMLNTLEASIGNLSAAAAGITSVAMTAGQTTLVVGTHVSAGPIETIRLTASAAENLQNITGATTGMIKIIIFEDTNVTVIHNVLNIKLNGDADNAFSTDDVLALVNIGGDGDSVNGYWHELFRTLKY